VEAEWNRISAETCQKDIKGLLRRIKAAVKAKEGHIDY
jgi:hypothetical protein